TSSITTNCGSLIPDARATLVAAGMPMATTKAARRMLAPACQPTAIQRVSSHQRRTVAADPQLPGPGWSRPVPKKVATSVAQSGAGETPALRSWASSVFIGIAAFLRHIGDVAYWRRDYIGSAGPLAQVNQAAAITAEREILVFRLHLLFAGRALKRDRTLVRHKV